MTARASSTRLLARSRARALTRPLARGARRGGALLLVLFATVALGAVAAAAVALTQTTTLVSAYQERERDFRYAAEMGLAIGRSRVERDTAFALPDSGWRKVLDSAAVADADGATIPRTRVTVYAGRSGITTGQFGQFVTLVAVADDGTSTRYVRRLELAAENFARFAMFTNTWSPAGLCYATGETIRGLAWSNQDWKSCGSPTYWDTVGAVGAITTIGAGAPTWIKLNSARPNQRPIPMPTVARLAALPAYATGAGLSFTPAVHAATRLEFAAVDANADGDSTDAGEGFLRVYDSKTDTASRNRVWLPDWPTGNVPPAWTDSLCGDFHGRFFFPVVAHVTEPGPTSNSSPRTAWMNRWLRGRGMAAATDTVGPVDGLSATQLQTLRQTVHDGVLQNASARCYPAGAPQLVFVERDSLAQRFGGGGTWDLLARRKGGEDTTFTPAGRWGAWRQWSGATAADVTTRMNNAARYLFPLSKARNPGWRGVVYVNGASYLSGQLRGRVTLYSAGTLTFVDDLKYVTPPNTPGAPCDAETSNMLGVIAVGDVMVEDNALHRPVRLLHRASNNVFFASGTGPHFQLHGVLMSLTGTVGVNAFGAGPSVAASACLGVAAFSGGCINQVGGVIQQAISATTSGVVNGQGTGFAENRETDRCMLEASPPYFPTTGRFVLNRYFESDPARFNADALYRTLQAY